MLKEHIPVLLNEVIEGLDLKPNQNCIDATLGGGGHAEAILEKTKPDGKLIGIDWDAKAIEITKERLNKFNPLTSPVRPRRSALRPDGLAAQARMRAHGREVGAGNRIFFIQNNYQNLKQIIKTNEQEFSFPIHCILLDLGLSLYQLQDEGRGFSFLRRDDLDMRYNPDSQEINARFVINNYREKQLADIFWEFGEEKLSKLIAREIIKEREIQGITRTDELANIIKSVYNRIYKKVSKKHPATKVFQALRIFINKELDNLKSFLPQAIDILESEGRLAVISYHSLEDRIVKIFFRKESRDCICPSEIPECRCNHKAKIRIINKKVIVPTEDEIENNHLSRSAKLRIVEKL